MVLRFEQVRSAVLSSFPEIRDWAVRRHGPTYDLDEEAPEQYPLFEDVIRQLLFQLLESRTSEPLLSRLFDFFEKMATSTDQHVRDLLGIAILERLVYDQEKVRRAWSYMGPRMKELVIDEARRQGRTDHLPVGL